MDSFGVEKTVILPHTDRFLFMGGGGTLNVMIHKAFIEGAISRRKDRLGSRKVGYENPCSILGISRELPK